MNDPFVDSTDFISSFNFIKKYSSHMKKNITREQYFKYAFSA